MEGLQNVAFLVVATGCHDLFGLDGNPIFLQPNQTAWPRNLTRTLLMPIATHPDTFFRKIWSCARPPRGGGPEIVATLGVLSTINPKLSPIKGPWCVTFGGRCELPRPVRSH